MATWTQAPESRADIPTTTGWTGHRWALAAVLIVGLVARCWNLTGYPQFSDDEGTYLAQAWAVQNGIGLAHYTYIYDHPPLGWIQISALSWLPPLVFPGLPAVATGRMVMLLFAAATIVLVYVVARRLHFSSSAGLVVASIYALSPLAIVLQRQVFLDNVGVAWMLAAIALALSPRRFLWSHVGAGVLASMAVLSKETLLLAVPALLYAVWQNAHPRMRSFAIIGLLCGLLSTLSFYPLYAVLNGELIWSNPDRVSLFEAWWYQLAGREGSGSLFDAGSEARATVYGWFLLDAPLLLLGSCSAVLAMMVPRLRTPAIAALVPMVLIVVRPDGYLPDMIVLQLLPFWILTAVGLAAYCGDVLRSRVRGGQVRAAAVGVVVTVVAVVLPYWASGWSTAWHSTVNDAYAQSISWMERQIQSRSDARIVTDDVIWLDLVELGYPTRQVVWHYKVDLDQSVRESMSSPDDGADFIVSSPTLRRTATDLPIVASLLVHSSPVAVFGTGADRVEIRAVNQRSVTGGG